MDPGSCAENNKIDEKTTDNGDIVIPTPKVIEETSDCEKLMEQVYDGNYFLLPLFAQSLISFLYEGMPVSENPRVLGHHIASRGMYILEKAHEMGTSKKQKEIEHDSIQYIESQPYKIRILRDCTFMLCGAMIQADSYLRALCLLFVLYKYCDEYKLITKDYSQIIDFSFIVFAAYFWCC